MAVQRIGGTLVVARVLHAFVPPLAGPATKGLPMTKTANNRTASGVRNDLATLEQKLGPIVYRPLASLIRFENNPRKHPEKQLVKLVAAMREFGFTIPVLIDENCTIIAGEA